MALNLWDSTPVPLVWKSSCSGASLPCSRCPSDRPYERVNDGVLTEPSSPANEKVKAAGVKDVSLRSGGTYELTRVDTRVVGSIPAVMKSTVPV
jgi:hypothetical protein